MADIPIGTVAGRHTIMRDSRSLTSMVSPEICRELLGCSSSRTRRADLFECDCTLQYDCSTSAAVSTKYGYG